MKKFFSIFIIVGLILLPVSTAFASTNSNDANSTSKNWVSGKFKGKNSGTISVGNALIMPNSPTGKVGPGNSGVDYLRARAIGSKMMDADWKLIAWAGPITYVDVYVHFDNGETENFAYSCFGPLQKNTAQTTFSTTGSHTAEFWGTGTISWTLDFTCDDLVDSDDVN